jgi:hypothetical protein
MFEMSFPTNRIVCAQPNDRDSATPKENFCREPGSRAASGLAKEFSFALARSESILLSAHGFRYVSRPHDP